MTPVVSSVNTINYNMPLKVQLDLSRTKSAYIVALNDLLICFSEALLALPVYKQESLETGFQYILAAATSPACKMNEETVTYLNQGTF